MGLCGGRFEVKVPARELPTQFVCNIRRKNRHQAARNRLVVNPVVFESRGQVEPVVQRGLIQQRTVIDEIAHHQNLVIGKVFVQPRKGVVVVGGSQHIQSRRLPRQAVDFLLDKVDGARRRVHGISNVGQNDRIVERRLAAPLTLVVGEHESLVFLQRSADGHAKLILSQGI